MRAFIAIDLPDEHKDRLSSLRADIPGAGWVRREGYHLTLRFLGDTVADGDVPKLVTALSAIQHESFEIVLAGVGRFPPGERQAARVLWVGIEANDVLNTLHSTVQAALAPLGFPPEQRMFNPHLTLARLKTPKMQPEAARFLREHADFRIEPFVAHAFHLFQSLLTPQGALYRRLASFGLL